MLQSITISLCTYLVFSACNNAPVASGRPVTKYIHADTTNRSDSYYHIRAIARQLQLSPPDNGFDSLQIRFWFDESLLIKRKMLLIEKVNGQWKGRLYQMVVDDQDTTDYELIKSYDSQPVEPLSGWQHLVDGLYQNKILDLPGRRAGHTDGITYCVEIMTPSRYTYYDYDEPQDNIDTAARTHNMSQIIQLIEQEFSIKTGDAGTPQPVQLRQGIYLRLTKALCNFCRSVSPIQAAKHSHAQSQNNRHCLVTGLLTIPGTGSASGPGAPNLSGTGHRCNKTTSIPTELLRV